MTRRNQEKGPRRQHWVPCFYLSYFATPESRDTEEPLIWVLSKEAGEPMLTSPRQIAAKNFLYSPTDRSGKRCAAMEEKLCSLEGLLSSAWPLLAEGFVDFHSDESMRKSVALFMSILHLRHPKALSAVESLHAQMVAAFEALPKDGAGQPCIESIERNGVVRSFDPSGWHEYRASGPNEKQRMFVDGIRQNGTYLAELLMKKRWSVVFSKQPVFITTDTPVTVMNEDREVFGLGTPGTRVFFPLSPTRVLMMDDRPDEPDGLYYPLLEDSRGAALFNFTAWRHAERFMIAPRHTDGVCAELLAWSEECEQQHPESRGMMAVLRRFWLVYGFKELRAMN